MPINHVLKILCLLGVLVLVACQPAAGTTTLPAATLTAPSIATETSVPQPTAPGSPVPIPTIPESTVELKGAEVPPGFSLIKFADLYRPTAFAFDAAGRMFVTSQDGNIYILQDED